MTTVAFSTDAASELDALRAELATYRAGIAAITTVARQAAAGNLEPRAMGIDPHGPIGELAQAVNHLLDLSDAFVRESRRRCNMPPRGSFTGGSCSADCLAHTATPPW
jgi:hypothetical protein